MQTKKYRRLIYARPSFLEGMARILDIGGTLNEYHFVSEDSPERKRLLGKSAAIPGGAQAV